MAKIRIHELAKELKMNSKDLIAQLHKMGYKVKNHMSTLDDKEVLKIKEKLQSSDTEAENKSTQATQQKKTKKPESNKSDYRKRSIIHKEEQRKKKEQNQRKVLAKVAHSAQRSRGKKRRKEMNRNSKVNGEPKKIIIENQISVQELANLLYVNGSEVIKKLIELGVMASLNQVIDSDTATLVATEFGVDVEVHDESQEWETLLEDSPDRPEDLEPKPPVVTVMGHVDHGKTSLLDFIRDTNVTAKEAGGITQHIGAYQIEIKGKKITFLDTPGHEAFTAMRARGAQVTDIAILVVAADDGVMPQTVEAINHAKAANVPIVVAINKIDKPGANPERIKQQLAEHNIVPEEWGGTTVCVPVSAKTGEGMDQLLEMLLLVAEMEELKANPNCPARGIVIEGELDKGRGPVATILIQKGTLEIGDVVLAGTSYGKVRAMLDFKGRRITKATPATPVEILGLSDVPEAGDSFYVLQDEKKARQFVEKRLEKKRQSENITPERVTLEDLFQQIKEGKVKELNLVIKADVQGSVEALIQALAKLHTDEVRINIIHSGVGAITETDVMLASASNALVIGFNVRPDVNAKKAAELEKVEVRLYRVIYEALEDLKAALEGLLEPIYKEVPLGVAEVRDLFHIPKIGVIAGCYVSEGKIIRNSCVRAIRDGVVVYDGTIASLKRFQEDVKEVTQGHECGIGLDKFQDLKIGDILEGYQIKKIKRELKP
jgi:translation initiation factor IF-2